MISRIPPLIMAVGVAVISIIGTMTGSRHESSPTRNISGVLYSIDKDTQAARVAAAEFPEIDVGLDPAARLLIPAAPAIVVRFVGLSNSTFTLTLARRLVDASARPNTEVKSNTAPSVQSLKKRGKTAKQPSTRSQIAPNIPPALPKDTVAAASVMAPVATFPITFAEIDDALRGSSTVKAINVRLKKDGVTFRLTHVGRVGNRYVVRYAIVNEEGSDFFLSIVNVTAAGKAIHAEQAGPYSCPMSQEVFGVVHFLPSLVAGKNVVIELVQSGGEHRRFSLPVDFAF